MPYTWSIVIEFVYIGNTLERLFYLRKFENGRSVSEFILWKNDFLKVTFWKEKCNNVYKMMIPSEILFEITVHLTCDDCLKIYKTRKNDVWMTKQFRRENEKMIVITSSLGVARKQSKADLQQLYYTHAEKVNLNNCKTSSLYLGVLKGKSPIFSPEYVKLKNRFL